MSFRYWVTQTTIDDDGHDAQAVLWTESYFKGVESSSGPVLPWRYGTDSVWLCVLSTRTGSVSTAVNISSWTATMTVFDPLTNEVVATPTVSIQDDGTEPKRGWFGLIHADTDTWAAGQWKFNIVFTVAGSYFDIIQGWIDILPAVPT